MANEDWAPDACTLPSEQRPLRIAEFDDLLSNVHELRRRSPTRLELLLPPAAEPAGRDLAERETACCSFFSFEFRSAADHLVMQIDVPPEYAEVLDALETRVS